MDHPGTFIPWENAPNCCLKLIIIIQTALNDLWPPVDERVRKPHMAT